MSAKKLLVCGGTGFLGRQICETAAAHGWRVTSLSRSRPANLSANVNFETLDLLNASQEQLQHYLQSADAVVYTLGILLESKYYKPFLASRNPIQGVKAVLDKFNRNPLKEPIEDDITYSSLNRDLAIRIAREAAAADTAKTFLYVSSAGNIPLIPHAYFDTKRQAEDAISNIKSLRSVFLRPGFMYDPSRQSSMYIKLGLDAVNAVNTALGGHAPVISAKALNPVSVSVVAGAAVRALADDNIQGVIDGPDLIRLAKEASNHA
ncbi:hypothetical protein V1514DRAFT_210606 [Lipomyces japonicus]|uniref:uncharacterized protein n=1 Tax=Lipomyces japonicus TaxID=56871 RepID=UPI0034CE448C